MTSAPRRTKQKAAVEAHLDGCADFCSAQHVHAALSAAGEKVGLATVYRALQAMAEAGEVDVIRDESGEARYRRCAISEHHHHLTCRDCGTTSEVQDQAVQRWAAEIARIEGFTQIEHSLELRGLCAACS